MYEDTCLKIYGEQNYNIHVPQTFGTSLEFASNLTNYYYADMR